ncbi:MAG TPA: hypothetical protein P5275_18905 [Saprospiraceae bacterium]|nr:hypothetical protein [Saprospiraceae bacterium]HRV86951.1 hypothetical protein [Saprospiraceae bacterium]
MKANNSLRSIILSLAFLMPIGMMLNAQKVNFWRPYGQNGLHVFEPGKADTVPFDGLKVRIGGAFAQQYQGLEHSNEATAVTKTVGGVEYNPNKLYALGKGFNLAEANMYIDAQLDDGIRLAVEGYMSARHHQEFWVKGGYIQVDKLPMFGNPEWFTKYFRAKIGHFEVNYGDQHFRRTDGGNAAWNPFVGNYVMDAFATEIGGEVYAFPTKNVTAMVGMTSGLINGDITQNTKKPSVYAKLAYDNNISDNMRFRISGSVYANKESGRNTLYGGDRTGSRFYLVMEAAQFVPRGASTLSSANATDNAFSGRINPGFTTNVTAWQIAPFVKVSGLEVFATFEQAKGYASSDPKTEGEFVKRKATQVAVEGLYRFLPREQVYVGARYNTVKGQLNARISGDQSVNRLELVAGWYATRNLLLKAEIVNQKYVDWPTDNIFYKGQFNGFMIEAAVGF